VKLETKSGLILLLTLLLGLTLGAMGSGAMARQRMDLLTRLRRPPGFAAHMHDVIRPTTPAQWDSLRPYVEITARRNEQIRRGMHEALRQEMDSLQLRLRPMLSAEQRARLQEFARRPPPPGPGGPPPRRGGGPPPREEGPPPPREDGPR
jgi:hypothetical protein